MTSETPDTDPKQPIFTLPGAVMALIGLLLAIHAAANLALDENGRLQLSLWFAFIPLRWNAPDLIPGGSLPLFWTPLTHAFLHAGWEHLLINSAWLAIFGTPVAQRYGPVSFFIIFALSAVAGAVVFAYLAEPSFQVLVGASGGISGLTGAAMRFVFQPVRFARHPETGELVVLGRRLAGFGDLMRSTRARTFIIVWVLINALAPFLPMLTGGVEVQIAWQAHLGGFFAGLLIVPIFERRPRRTDQEPE